ncbi:MAG: DUF2459 domain-containing protein [Xenococcaceae cyanobacterium]
MMLAFETFFLVNSSSGLKIRKIFGDFLTLVISIFLFLLIGSLIPRKWGNDFQEICECQICVSNSGFHTDLLVPVQNQIFDWQNYLSEKDIPPDVSVPYRYVGFGRGDRTFYMEPPPRLSRKLSTGFKALFLPTPSVIRVQGHRKIPQNIEVKCFGVSRIGYLKLIEFIKASFQLDNQGRKILIGYDRHFQASFYGAKGSYSLLRNSNSWTAEGLRSANVNTPLWTGFSWAIMFHLNRSCELDPVKV